MDEDLYTAVVGAEEDHARGLQSILTVERLQAFFVQHERGRLVAGGKCIEFPQHADLQVQLPYSYGNQVTSLQGLCDGNVVHSQALRLLLAQLTLDNRFPAHLVPRLGHCVTGQGRGNWRRSASQDGGGCQLPPNVGSPFFNAERGACANVVASEWKWAGTLVCGHRWPDEGVGCEAAGGATGSSRYAEGPGLLVTQPAPPSHSELARMHTRTHTHTHTPLPALGATPAVPPPRTAAGGPVSRIPMATDCVAPWSWWARPGTTLKGGGTPSPSASSVLAGTACTPRPGSSEALCVA